MTCHRRRGYGGLLQALLPALVVLMLTGSEAMGAWWDAAWPYRRGVMVTWRDEEARGTELAQATIYTAGHHREDGSDIRVATHDGRLVPFEVLKVGPGDEVSVAWQLRKGYRQYFIYFGHENPPALPADLPPFKPTGGLLFETRRWDGQGDDPRALKRAFERSKPVLGKAMIEQPFIGYNPATLEQRTVSRFAGTLFVPLDGTYLFAMAADDRGALYIDGNLQVQARGAPGDTRFNQKVELKRGHHEIEIYHADYGGEFRLSLGWQRPDMAKVDVIPKDAFGLLYPAEVGPLEHAKGQLVASLEMQYLAETFFADDYAHHVRFTAPELAGVSYEWDFGDGVRGRGRQVEHLYLRGGVYPVRLTAQSRQQKDTQTTKVHITRDFTRGREPRAIALPDTSAIVAGYDVTKLSSRMLVRAVQLHQRAGHREPMLHAAEALAKMRRHADAEQVLTTLREATRDAMLNGRGDRAIEVLQQVPADASIQPKAAEMLAEYLLWWRGDPAAAARVLAGVQASSDSAKLAYGQALVLSGQVEQGRKILQALPVEGDPSKRPAISGAMARTVEYFIGEKEWEAGEEQWQQWQARYPTDFLEGYSVLLRTRLMALRGFQSEAAAVAGAFATAVPESSYAPRLLHYASELLKERDPQRSQALRALLRERYPEDPLAQ